MADIASSTGTAKTVFLIAIAVYALVVGLALVRATRRRSVVGVVVALWMSSIVPVWFVGRVLEHRWVFSLEDQSWAFMFGDSIFLPFAGVMFVLALRRLPDKGLPIDRWRPAIVSAVLGLGAGVWFHRADGAAYDPLRLNSPTKLVHDFVAYPLLVGGLVFLGVAAIVAARDRYDHNGLWLCALGVMLGVGGWLLLALKHDAHLVPDKVHIPYRWNSPVGPAQPGPRS